MIYSILLLMLFSAFFLIRNYRNRYSLLFVLMLIGMGFSFFGMILNVSKVGTYPYPTNILYAFDYRVYLYLSSLKINYYDTVRLQLIGSTIYLVSIPLFIFEFTRGRNVSKWSKIVRTCLLSLPLLVYIWFYDPETRYALYIQMVSNNEQEQLLRFLLQAINMFNVTWILLYLFYPIWHLYKKYRATRIAFQRKQVLSIIFSLLCMNSLFIAVFIIGPYSQFFLLSSTDYLLQFTDQSIPQFYYKVLPFFMFIAVQVLIITLIWLKGVDATTLFKNRLIHRNIGSFNQNLKGVFHSFKNTMFTVSILAKQAEHQYGSEAGIKAIKRLQEVSDASLQQSGKVIDAIQEIRVRPVYCKLVHLVEEALQQINLNQTIVVEKRYLKFSASSYVDHYLMVEALVNLLQNAQESILSVRKGNGEITIEVDSDQDWVQISITDNGKGIEAKNKKLVFHDFYTTKSKHENWGVGLSYVNRIVKAHLGFILVKSKPEEYATFQILLPVQTGGHHG